LDLYLQFNNEHNVVDYKREHAVLEESSELV